MRKILRTILEREHTVFAVFRVKQRLPELHVLNKNPRVKRRTEELFGPELRELSESGHAFTSAIYHGSFLNAKLHVGQNNRKLLCGLVVDFPSKNLWTALRQAIDIRVEIDISADTQFNINGLGAFSAIEEFSKPYRVELRDQLILFRPGVDVFISGVGFVAQSFAVTTIAARVISKSPSCSQPLKIVALPSSARPAKQCRGSQSTDSTDRHSLLCTSHIRHV
jgi:hypothetical protein